MNLASDSVVPFTPVLDTRSDPARSTRLSFARRTMSSPGFRDSMYSVKMQWDRLLAMFMGVSLIVRFVSPRKRKLRASSSFVARCADRFRMWKLPLSSSRSPTRGRSSSDRISRSGSRRSYPVLL